MKKQLSFVLPLTLKERRKAGVRELKWRSDQDGDALLRTHMLLTTFIKNFRQEDVSEFIVVCPEDDLTHVSSLLASITRDSRYRAISESVVCPLLAGASSCEESSILGWFAQQLIKLSISRFIASSHYLTLDSDVLCLRSASYTSLIHNGLAVTNVETPRDYNRLYVKEFALQEIHGKRMRYLQSASILGYARPVQLLNRFYGETPVVFHTASVLALTKYIENRFGQAWDNYLACNANWTEYTLYFQFLEMFGLLDFVCVLKGPNCILDLYKSVWQSTPCYKVRRKYDRDHFTKRSIYGTGNFVAIQSWLPLRSWLPTRYKTLPEFYREVEQWLTVDR